jgi:hypothetical protein
MKRKVLICEDVGKCFNHPKFCPASAPSYKSCTVAEVHVFYTCSAECMENPYPSAYEKPLKHTDPTVPKAKLFLCFSVV